MRIAFLVLAWCGMSFAADAAWQLTKARQSMEEGRIDRAWSRYLKAESLAQQQGDRSTWIVARTQRTELLLLSEEFAAADSLCPSLSLLGETPADSARIRLARARVLLAKGEPEKALPEAWAARLNAHSADIPELEAASWLALSRSESQSGKGTEARQSLEEARSRADGQPNLVAQGWFEEARQKLSNPDKALACVRTARESFRAARWPSGIVRSLELEATLLEAMGRKDAARQAWQEMSDLAERLVLGKAQARAQAHLR